MSRPEPSSLTASQRGKLSYLGYTKADYAALSSDEVAAIIHSKTRKGAPAKEAALATPTITPAIDDNPPAGESTPLSLSPAESAALELLGYLPEHVQHFSADDVALIIQTRTTRPGSRAHNETQPFPLPDKYTDEAIKEANESRAVSSGVQVRVDEFTQQCVRGDDPLDALLLQCQEAYPNDVIRLVNPDLPTPAGQAFQQIYSTDGKPLGTGGLLAMRMPKALYEEAYVKPNLKKSQAMMGGITQGKEDADVQIAPSERHYAPVQGKGLTIAPNLANL